MKKFVILLIVICMLMLPITAKVDKREIIKNDEDIKELSEMVNDIVRAANEAINMENIEKVYIADDEKLSNVTEDDITISDVYKMYTDADDILNAESEAEIKEILSDCPYRWVLILEVGDGVVVEIHIKKTSTLTEEERKLTYREKEAIYQERGEYGVAYVALYNGDSFYKKALNNEEFTYFANISSMGTVASIQAREDGCYILCEKGEASEKYVSINRIEIIEDALNDGRMTGIDTAYTVKSPDFSLEIIIFSLSLAIVVVFAVTFIKTYKRKKV